MGRAGGWAGGQAGGRPGRRAGGQADRWVQAGGWPSRKWGQADGRADGQAGGQARATPGRSAGWQRIGSAHSNTGISLPSSAQINRKTSVPCQVLTALILPAPSLLRAAAPTLRLSPRWHLPRPALTSAKEDSLQWALVQSLAGLYLLKHQVNIAPHIVLNKGAGDEGRGGAGGAAAGGPSIGRQLPG